MILKPLGFLMNINITGNTKIDTKGLVGSYDGLHKIELEDTFTFKSELTSCDATSDSFCT